MSYGLSAQAAVLFAIRNPRLIPTYNSPTLNEHKINTNACSFDLTNFFCTSQQQIKQNGFKDNVLNYAVILEHSSHLSCTSNEIAFLIPFLAFTSVSLTYIINSIKFY